MVRRARGFGAALGLATMMLAPAVLAQERPLPRGGTVVLPLETEDGDYVRGSIAVRAGRFDLTLETGSGGHIRRLAGSATGLVPFQFVAGRGPLRLKAVALEDGGFLALRVEARIARAGQVAPAAVPLSPRIAALASRVAAGGGTDAFWADIAREGTPLIEPGPDGHSVVTFLARGAERNVRLFGAPSGDHDDLQRLGASDTWFRSYVLPNATRLSYQLAADVPDLPGSARERRVAILATAKADPFNRHPWPADAPDAYARESVLELPEAPPQPGLADRGAPRGSLVSFRVASARLGNSRLVTLYRPAGWNPAASSNRMLFLFDGVAYQSRVPTPLILDNLIAEGRIPPTAAVFVSEIDRETRARELPSNDAFADFMAGELLPRIRRETGADIPAARTILAGSSFGGLAAATVALRHPQAFGCVIGLSGSFWWSPPGTPAEDGEHVAARVAREPVRPVRFHLTAGLFETAHGGAAGILETSRHLRDVLRARGYTVSYREYAAGHDYIVWRGALADALIATSGSPGSGC